MNRPKFFKPFVLATLLSPLAASSCDSVPAVQETQELEQAPVTAALTLEGAEINPERRGIGLETPQSAGSGDLPLAVRFDARRSLAVTDVPIVSKFSFREVMDKIAGGKDLGLGLFQRWFATQGSACQPTLNGFDYPCRPSGEGQEETNADPFGQGDSGYMALGLFNRFDLAPKDGANCGEYRVVFGRRSGATNSTNRNLIIFEAVLPNPTPARGLEGCRPVANFWDGLSDMSNIEERATALKSFYFRGLAGFAPVIAAEHYAEGAGQIRTNQFMQFTWSLREFKFQPGPQPTIKPVTVKTNPHFALFDAAPFAPLTPFQRDFVSQVPSLRSGDINTFTYNPPASANRGDSDSQLSAHDYASRPINVLSTFARNINTASGALTRGQVLNRATALSCSGCHQHSNGKDIGQNVRWPSSLGFVHISEETEVTVEGIRRHRISPALTSTFLPHRQAVLEAFLNRLSSCPQTTLSQRATLQPDSEWGKDAMIVSRFNSNNGDHPSLLAVAWGTGSQSAIVRSLIDFDVSHVAPKSRVTRAALRLFGTGSNVGSSNRGMLSRITQPWNESAVTWFTSPASDRSQPVMIEATSNASQDYSLNVTGFIQAKLAAPGQNHGMLLELAAESHHNELHFHSSDSTEPSRRPVLDLMVTTPICAQ